MTARRAHIIGRQTPLRDGSIAFAGFEQAQLMRVRPGAYVRKAEWDALFTEGRLRTRAAAVLRRAENPRTTVAGAAAAALHGLPVYRAPSDRVEVVVPSSTSRQNSADVIRRHVPLPDTDVVIIDGLRVTSLDRTIYDVARLMTLEGALVCFDAALRLTAWDDETGTYDESAASGFRARVRGRIHENTGARGIRQARLVTELADGRAQLPGESISRLWMWQLGVPTPELQYRVDFGDATFALLDFAWPALARWGEFDGQVKYTDADMLRGRTAAEVLEDQNMREQRVRRATAWKVDRWGFAELASIDVFAAWLRTNRLFAP